MADSPPGERETHIALEAIRTRLMSLEAANDRLRGELACALAEVESAHFEAAAHRQVADAARADLLQITTEFERANDELRRECAAAVGEQTLACTALPLDGLLTAFTALQRTTTAPALLDEIVTALAREFSRVALFRLRGAQLQGARQVGFDFAHDISKIAMPLTADTLLARAVGSRQLESVLGSGEADSTLPFGGTPACAVAIPFVLRKDIVGVVYADDSDTPGFLASAPHTRLKFAELLRQHGSLLLLKVGIDDGRAAEFRDVAAMLVEELEYGHAADAACGVAPAARQERLAAALDRARRMYRRYVTRQTSPGVMGFLDEQITAAIDARPDAAFARELARVLPASSLPSHAHIVSMPRS